MDLQDQDFIDEQFDRLYGEKIRWHIHTTFGLDSLLRRFIRDNNIRSRDDIYSEVVANNAVAFVEELVACIGYPAPEDIETINPPSSDLDV